MALPGSSLPRRLPFLPPLPGAFAAPVRERPLARPVRSSDAACGPGPFAAPVRTDRPPLPREGGTIRSSRLCGPAR